MRAGLNGGVATTVPLGTFVDVTIQTIHHEMPSTASRADVYQLLADSETWPLWTPIDSCDITVPEAIGQPEERIFVNGRYRVHERVIEKTPDEAVAYTLISGLAVKDYMARISLATVTEGTLITWHTTFRAKIPGTGLLYRSALDKATLEFLRGLAKQAVTL